MDSEAVKTVATTISPRVGDRDLSGIRDLLPARGCIIRPQQGMVVRRSGVFHRPHFRPVNCVVRLVAPGGFWRLAKGQVRDQGLTVIWAEVTTRLGTQSS